MANILIISSDFPPLNSVASRRLYSWAKYLSKLGHKVFVSTPKKHYFEEEMSFNVDISFLSVFETDFINMRKFIHLMFNIRKYEDLKNVSEGRKKSFLMNFLKFLVMFLAEKGVFLASFRMPNFLDLWIFPATKEAKKIIKNYDIDTIITSYSPPASHIIGYFLKRKFRELLWIGDYRDLWTVNPIKKGLFLFSGIERLVESKCIEKTDVIITVSEILKRSLIGQYGKKELEVVENGYDEELFNVLPESSNARSSKVRIVYAGTVYKQRRYPDLLFKAMYELFLTNPKEVAKVEVVFFSNYHTFSILEELFVKYSLGNVVKYGGFKPAQEIFKEILNANALLFLEQDDQNDGVLTGKIFEYMYARKPIFCIGIDRGSYVGEFLHKTGLCFFCGNDIDRIKNFILQLQKGNIRVTPNEEYISQFSRKKQTEVLSNIIASYAQGRKI